MKHFQNILSGLLAFVLFTSCSGDDNNGANPGPAGGDHTYAIEVTSGFLAGTSFAGSVANHEFMGLYTEETQQDLMVLSQSLQGQSGFFFGGGVTIQNGQPLPLTNTNNGLEGSSLLIGFDIDSVTYLFESMSGTCSVTGLNKFPAAAGTGIASYILSFSGTFRQANTGGPDEDAPLVQISGNLNIKNIL